MSEGQSHKGTKGFTLIELSIVLVIIGLIVGGILTGQSLIRQSQINSAMMDAQRYIAAAGAFQQKYGALPGDFANATSYWGIAAGATGNDSTCQLATGTLPATCNGNGDGQVYNPSTAGTQNVNEALRFWQHLVDAQFISGSYTGIGGSGGTLDHVVGTNCPATRIDGAGFGISYVGAVTSTGTNYYSANYGHVLTLGGYKSNNLPVSAILTTVEAQGFDNKYDDGAPSTGNVLTWVKTTGYAPTCVTGTTTLTYNTGTTGRLCSLILITGF